MSMVKLLEINQNMKSLTHQILSQSNYAIRNS